MPDFRPSGGLGVSFNKAFVACHDHTPGCRKSALHTVIVFGNACCQPTVDNVPSGAATPSIVVDLRALQALCCEKSWQAFTCAPSTCNGAAAARGRVRSPRGLPCPGCRPFKRRKSTQHVPAFRCRHTPRGRSHSIDDFHSPFPPLRVSLIFTADRRFTQPFFFPLLGVGCRAHLPPPSDRLFFEVNRKTGPPFWTAKLSIRAGCQLGVLPPTLGVHVIQQQRAGLGAAVNTTSRPARGRNQRARPCLRLRWSGYRAASCRTG